MPKERLKHEEVFIEHSMECSLSRCPSLYNSLYIGRLYRVALQEELA